MAPLVLLIALAPIAPEKLGLLPQMWPRKRRALEQKVRPLLERGQDIAPVLIAAGIDARLVDLLKRVEAGPLLEERYARRLVFFAPDLTDRQRRLFGHLVPGVDGAERALVAAAKTLRDEVTQASLQRRIQLIEKRFWRIAGLTLTVPQRIALRKLYPPRYAEVPDLLGHIYRLPGLTPVQANRIRALATEFESENAADAAQEQRLRREPATNPQLEEQLFAVGLRMGERLEAAFTRGRAVLTAAQLLELDALPPMLDPATRRQHPGEMVKTMRIAPHQQAKLDKLGARIEQRVRAIQGKAHAKSREMEGQIGEESPQAMMMQMVHLGAEAGIVAAFEAAAREAIEKVLTQSQLLGWIVGE